MTTLWFDLACPGLGNDHGFDCPRKIRSRATGLADLEDVSPLASSGLTDGGGQVVSLGGVVSKGTNTTWLVSASGNSRFSLKSPEAK